MNNPEDLCPFSVRLCFHSTPNAFLQLNGVVPWQFSGRAASEFQVLLEMCVSFSTQLLSEEQFEYAKQS